jgi:hypothetical protein
VVLICFGGSASAGKPKLAILGLEVAPGPTGVVDPAVTQVAKDITKELRQRAQSGASAYVVAPNSSKELTDEKLLMSCDNEARDCMAMIGVGLAADALLYGHVEKKGEVYRVSLKLLDVKAKTIEPGSDEMPVGGSVAGLSRRLYGKLVGDSPSGAGALLLTARSQSGAEVNGGRVMVDEDRKGVLSGGKLTVAGLTEGRHVVAIEVGGLQRFEATVTVHGGEQSTLDALLLDRVAQVSPSRSHAVLWKVSLGTGIAIAAASGAFAIYGYDRMTHHKGSYDAAVDTATGKLFLDPTAPDESDCDRSEADLVTTKHAIVTDKVDFQRGCTWKSRIYTSFVIGSVGLLGAVASLVMLARDPGSEERPPTGARGKQPSVALRPIVSPDFAGGSLTLSW